MARSDLETYDPKNRTEHGSLKDEFKSTFKGRRAMQPKSAAEIGLASPHNSVD
jgi:hypothetical protein